MSTPLYWNMLAVFLTMTGEKCGHCGKIIFPPRDICPECRSKTLPEGVNFNADLRRGRIRPPPIGGRERR